MTKKCLFVIVGVSGGIMKLLIVKHDKNYFNEYVDGYILPLENFSVSYSTQYSLKEIKDIALKKEVFVLINKNITNSEVPLLEEILKKLSNTSVSGILFYDLSVLSIVRRCNLSLNLVWNQTHMVTNYNTINYYYEKGVRGAFLSNEITLEEMLQIKEKTESLIFANIIYRPIVSFSKRHLVQNYYKSFSEEKFENPISVCEEVSGQEYLISEESDGTTIILSSVVNGSFPLVSMVEKNFDYGVIDFKTGDMDFIVSRIFEIMRGNCNQKIFDELEEKIGNYTGFFYKKTYYKVK